MEVAVIITSRTASYFRSITMSLLAGCLLVLSTGCADSWTDNTSPRNKGIALYKQGEYADAAGSFRNAIREDPRDYKSHYYLAASYQGLGQYQQAIQAYKSTLSVMTTTLAGQEDKQLKVLTLDGLAFSIAKSTDRNEELDAIQKRASTTQSAQDYLLMAKVYRYGGDADNAIDNYNRAALLDPKDFLIVKEFGLYLEQLGQTQRAETPLRRAYALNQKDQEVQDALRRIGVTPGPSLKAQQDLEKPLVPQGPLPEVDLNKIKLGKSKPAPSESPVPPPSAQAPRD
jgi:Tfp pilus assembly protein PilF